MRKQQRTRGRERKNNRERKRKEERGAARTSKEKCNSKLHRGGERKRENRKNSDEDRQDMLLIKYLDMLVGLLVLQIF